MRTTKPIATISFNTPEYLALKLRELQKAGRVSFWAFVVHEPEDDEGGTKQHAHVYLEPSKMLQTDDLREALKEFDPTKPDKPRGCLTFVSSKFDPWYMYALHDKRYLAYKREARRYHYAHEDIVTSDEDDLLYKARMIDLLALSPYADMEEAQAHGITFAEYFRRGTIPIQQVGMWQQAWTLLATTATDRGGRRGHAMAVDPETGEVLEETKNDPETARKRLYGDWPKPKTDDELRNEVVAEASRGLEGPSSSYYDIHPNADHTPTDPETGLPW